MTETTHPVAAAHARRLRGATPSDARRRPAMGALAALAMAAALAGCGTTARDETAGMSVEKLYEEAKDEASVGNWERATKLYEKLEARAAGTPMAQQAQLDLAYAFYRSGEKAQALSTLDRFIRLHPSSPALDYAYYLQGLVNFNENLGLAMVTTERSTMYQLNGGRP